MENIVYPTNPVGCVVVTAIRQDLILVCVGMPGVEDLPALQQRGPEQPERRIVESHWAGGRGIGETTLCFFKVNM